MHWTYDQLLALPEHIYTILIDDLNREANGLNRDI